MNAVCIYPSKVRFYSPGRSENWSRFKSTNTFARNQENAHKIRGTSLSGSNEPLNKAIPNIQYNFPTPIRKRVVSGKLKQSNSPKAAQRTPTNENLPEKYTYGKFFNKFDICGKPVSALGTGYGKFKGKNQKKRKNLYFKLPVVNYPPRLVKENDIFN